MLRKAQKIGIIATLILIIGGTLTFLMTWKNIGFTHGFSSAWLSSFTLSVLCIAPLGGVIALLVNRLITKLLPNLTQSQNSIVFGIAMAVAMESIMSVVTTINLYGLGVLKNFGGIWFSTFLAALPMGIVFSVIISLIVKPRLAIFWAKK